jgi:hypothetical protein
MMNQNTMSREIQQTVDTSNTDYGESIDADLLVNNLIYEMPKALSLAVSRQHVLQYPQRSTYPLSRNTTVVFDWNTGNAFIDPSNSFLKFKLVVENPTVPAVATVPTFGVGSALNSIHEARVRSRSGVELDRTENLNLYNTYRIDYNKTQQYKNTIGKSFFIQGGTEYPIFNTNNTLQTEIVIPLSEICSFFRPLKAGQLLPPQLVSGLRIELSLESIAKTFVDTAGWFGPNAKVTLEDIHMSLDTVIMSDETSKLMNLESSNTGLEYCYERVYNYSNTFTSPSNFTLQMSKAVSQATHVFCVVQNNANVDNIAVDSFISEPYKIKSWQYRLGAQYYPHIPVITNTTATTLIKGNESYILALASYDKMRKNYQETSVTFSDFAADKSILSVSLEKNQSLSVSGLPSNNSRQLELLVTRDNSGDVANSKVDANSFLTYISIAKAYIDNVAVAI